MTRIIEINTDKCDLLLVDGLPFTIHEVRGDGSAPTLQG